MTIYKHLIFVLTIILAMSFFSDIKNKFEGLSKQLDDRIQSNRAPPVPPRPGGGGGFPGNSNNNNNNNNNNAPPPIPPRPGQSSSPTPYWQADFSPNNPVSAQWEHKTGNNYGWGNNELENYTSEPRNSFHTPDHKLIIRAIAQPNHADPNQKFTSARLVSRQTLARNRGCLSTTLTLPCASGIWPAFWLLPREPFKWPEDGEIDIAETWNGDCINHSCFHWGQHNFEERNKHIVRETHLGDMHTGRPIRYDFVWDCPSGGTDGRLMWFIDGRAVMKAVMPQGTRPIAEWNVLINVAMGGNGCGGQVPGEGSHDYVVHEVVMTEEPWGGWGKFDGDWNSCP